MRASWRPILVCLMKKDVRGKRNAGNTRVGNAVPGVPSGGSPNLYRGPPSAAGTPGTAFPTVSFVLTLERKPRLFDQRKRPWGRNDASRPAQMPDLQQRRRGKSRTAYYSKCYFTFYREHCQAQLRKTRRRFAENFVILSKGIPEIGYQDLHRRGAQGSPGQFAELATVRFNRLTAMLFAPQAQITGRPLVAPMNRMTAPPDFVHLGIGKPPSL